MFDEMKAKRKQKYVCYIAIQNSNDFLQELCYCTHKWEVDLGQIVDIVMVNEAFVGGYTGHPMHLHGYHFRVIAQGKVISLFQISTAYINILFSACQKGSDYSFPMTGVKMAQS